MTQSSSSLCDTLDSRERTDTVQMTFFEAEAHPVVEALKGLDVETLTPLEALTQLAELQKLVKG